MAYAAMLLAAPLAVSIEKWCQMFDAKLLKVSYTHIAVFVTHRLFTISTAE